MCEPDYLVEGHKSQEAPPLETYDPHPSSTIESPLGTGATTEERTRIFQVMYTNAFKGSKKTCTVVAKFFYKCVSFNLKKKLLHETAGFYISKQQADVGGGGGLPPPFEGHGK